MGFFSKTCEYGLRAVFYLAHHSNVQRKVRLKEIANEIDSPEHFLAKILQELSKKQIIQSAKGPHGGFYLNRTSLQRPISDIVESLDGKQIFTGCAMGLNRCSSIAPCPLHDNFVEIRDELSRMMKNTKVVDFNGTLNNEFLILKNR